MQPKDQTSTEVEYFSFPSKISGALYQRVTTSWVYSFRGIQKVLARPKSASLIPRFSLSTRMFCGLRSLWIILLAWQQSTANNSWYRTFLQTSSDRGPASRYFLRSMSTKSKMRLSLLLPQITSLRHMMLGCCSPFSREISLTAVEGMPSSSCSSLIFLRATTSPVILSLALQTTPQVPSPILLTLWYLSSS